jgi:hypothetical protein
MNFLYPAFLLGALAVGIPVALHLLRRDVAPDVPFTAVRLLRKSPVERSRRRRLRDLLLLAARVAALLLLAAAFARPYLPAAAASASGLRIIAIDRSFSMDAPGRFTRALELARAAIGESRFGERVAVIAFDERADVIAPPGSAGDARAAVGTLTAGAGATRYAAAFAKAAELAAGGAATLIVVTDLQRAGWTGEARARVPASLTVDVRDAGAPVDNLSVAAVRVEEGAVVATVRNGSRITRDGVVVLRHNGEPVSRAPYHAAADTSVDVPIAWRGGSEGAVSVSIEDPSGFAADNVRHVIVRNASAAPVMVITSKDASGFFLFRALDAAGAGTSRDLAAQQVNAEQIAGGRSESIARHGALVLLSTRNLDRPARDAVASFVKKGGGLLIAASPDVDPLVVADMFGWGTGMLIQDDGPRAASFAATDLRHPIFRPFGSLAANLGQVRFQQAWRVRPDGWQVPARFSDGSPAVLERQIEAGKIVLFASDMDRRWNDFPLHPGFVPFVVETVRYVAARRILPTEFLVSRVPPGAVRQPGIQQLEGRTVAVNVDPRESGTAAMTRAEFLAQVESAPAAAGAQTQVKPEQTESRQNFWQFGLALMLLTLVVESFVGKA